MSIKQAIILAAGSSKRLRPLTNDIPKTLLRVGRSTILDLSIAALTRCGIHDIVIVAGYASDRLIEYVKRRGLDAIAKIRFIINDNFDRGNIYSFYIARDCMYDDFILLNSDVIFHPKILEYLLTHEGSALAVDDKKELGEEEMKVKVNSNGIIKDISKSILPEQADGEYIGLMKFDRRDARKVLDAIESLFDDDRYDLYYEDAIRLVANSEDCFYKCSTNGLPSIEIDTLEDLENAKYIIKSIE